MSDQQNNREQTDCPDAERRKLINRLKRIEGQVRGLEHMVESDAGCTDILTQSAAVSAALKSFNKDLIARYIRNCVVRDIRSGTDAAAEELSSLIQKLMK